MEVVKILPLTNCRKCGYSTCIAFAKALSRGRIKPDACPCFAAPISVEAVYPVLDRDGTLASTISIAIDGPVNKIGGVGTPSNTMETGSKTTDKAVLDNQCYIDRLVAADELNWDDRLPIRSGLTCRFFPFYRAGREIDQDLFGYADTNPTISVWCYITKTRSYRSRLTRIRR